MTPVHDNLANAQEQAERLIGVVSAIRNVGHPDDLSGLFLRTWVPAVDALSRAFEEASAAIQPILVEVDAAANGVLQVGGFSEVSGFRLTLRLARSTISLIDVVHKLRESPESAGVSPITTNDKAEMKRVFSAVPRVGLAEWNLIRAHVTREALNTARAREYRQTVARAKKKQLRVDRVISNSSSTNLQGRFGGTVPPMQTKLSTCLETRLYGKHS